MNETESTPSLADYFKGTEFKFSSEKTGAILSIRPFGGKMSFSVFGKQNTGVQFSKPIDMQQLAVLETAMGGIMAKGPGSKTSLTFTTWVFAEKKDIPQFTLNVIKDDRQVYLFELKGRGNNGGEYVDQFVIGPRLDKVLIDGEQQSIAAGSASVMSYLRTYFKLTAPLEAALKSTKFQGGKFSKGGSGYQKGGYRGNYQKNNSGSQVDISNTGADLSGFEDASGKDDIPF